MTIGGRKFENYTYVMAIINVTPDSFYAPSRVGQDEILFRAERALKEGAAILDIGAQSTRPGHTPVGAEQELSRLEAPLTRLRREFDVPVSVDTYHSSCAEAALALGADMINDVWGLTYDGNMARTVARGGGSVCIMHNSSSPLKGDVFAPVIAFLQSSVKLALDAGIAEDKICLDGGIGFAKDGAQSLALIDGYERLSALGYPLLLGASRKSLFGGSPDDRLAATLESTKKAAKKGVLFVRVHDVAENVQAIREVYER